MPLASNLYGTSVSLMVMKGISAVQAGHEDWEQFEAEEDKEENVGDCWVFVLDGVVGLFCTGTEAVDAVECGDDDSWGFNDSDSKLSNEFALDLWIVWVQNKTLGPWTSQKCNTDSNAFMEWLRTFCGGKWES